MKINTLVKAENLRFPIPHVLTRSHEFEKLLFHKTSWADPLKNLHQF